MARKTPSRSVNEHQVRRTLAEICAELDMRRVGKALLPALLGASLTGCPPKTMYAGPPPDDPRIEEPVPVYAVPDRVDPQAAPPAQIPPADDVGDLYAAPEPVPEYAVVEPDFEREAARPLYAAPEPE